MASFNPDFAWDSAMALRAVSTACARSASVTLSTLGPCNERTEESSPDTRAEGTTPSDPSVSLHALTAKLGRNSCFTSDDRFEVFETYVLLVHCIFLQSQVHCDDASQISSIRHHRSR